VVLRAQDAFVTAALAAGTELTLIGATRTGARRYRAVVSDVLQDRIVLDAGHDDLPASGSCASFLHDGRLFACEIVAGGGSQLAISRPDDVDADDRRVTRRIATSLPASLRRSNLGGQVQAAYVVDLSLGGAKLLTEELEDGLGVDHEVEVLMGAIATTAWVRHVERHTNPKLRYVGIEFGPMGEAARRHLLETVGSLRAGMHRWR
jgi:hypothetical protein